MPTDLTSADNPRIKEAHRLLTDGRHRRREGRFLAEGMRQVGRAIDAGIAVEELFWSPTLLGDKSEQIAAWQRQTGAAGFTLTDRLMAKISYCEHPEGVVAICRTPQRELAELIKGASLLLVAVGLEKPGNLGAIARSADAAGAAGLIVADGVVDPFHPNALTASTGAVFTLPVVGGTSSEVRAALRVAGIRLIVTSPAAKGDCFHANLTGKVAIVIGSEDKGLDGEWLAAGEAVAIPMAGRTADSLNASTAAAVLLFESVRQSKNK